MAMIPTTKAVTVVGALLALLSIWVLLVQFPTASQDVHYTVTHWSSPGHEDMSAMPTTRPSPGPAEIENTADKFTPE